ncbi:MFS transporter [Comamonas aquatica]|jgi:MFS family permease|uniref:Arabinose ABC transporter permease n=1 Tax=Comamonas aquatica DA1877 TaxID=1457173 RepID=A0A014Q885_9BURK|nr:MFS transporter [Comamonas aquatica]EXU79367.1 arabinose ABC transporter permease [Comamonas aquatica DA1877]MDH1902028.1 MFS transporter [Comamonas aquatica]WBM42486.1 MFS transporter [Comamonas aquatica]
MTSFAHPGSPSGTAPVDPGLAHAHSHQDVTPGEIAAGVIIGRASEYFDFFVFGIACVLVFPYVYFPFLTTLNGMLAAFAVFALAFFARPVGTAVGMAVQRRWGMAVKLTIALFLLGSATVGIALLPGYESIGVAAIWWLVGLRVAQGLAVGGSWEGLPSLLAMNAPKAKRGWYAMIGQLGAPIGFVAAASVFAYIYGQLSHEELLAWGWRYPFCVAFAINVVALFARLRLVADESYTTMFQTLELKPTPTLELARSGEGRNVFLGALAALASFALFHLVTVFPLSWMTLYGEASPPQILWTQVAGALVACAAIVLSGWMADRFGRRNTLGAMAVLIGLFSFATPMLLNGGTAGQNLFILIGFALLGLSYGQSSGTVTANFSRKFRFVGAAYSADLAWLLGAALAPLVALYLSSHFGPVAVGGYLLSGAVCTLAALGINRALETSRK